MTQRITYLLKIFITLLLFFMAQKILFILLNQPITFSDFCQVYLHGLGLDLSTSGYLITIPFLVLWAGMYLPKLNHKAWLLPYYLLIAFALSLICVADTSLYSFWQFKLDATIFNYTDSPRQAVASVSIAYLLWRALWILLFAAALSYILIKITPKHFKKLQLNPAFILHNIIYILIGGLIFLAIRGGTGRSTMNIGNAYFSERTFLNHAAVNPAFSLFYSWNKAEDFAGKYNYLDKQQLSETYSPLYPASTGGLTQTLVDTIRPNLLIIILEGFGGDYVKELGGNESTAPNLSRLIKEGVFFDNVLANSFRTDRGLVSTLSGHISYPTNSIMKLPAKSRNLPSLARTLQNAGYHTDFVYGGDINFTNMRSYFTTTGYQHLTSDADFTLQERTSSSWGAHDQYAFARVLDMIKEKNDSAPWHIGLLTLSSHEPFEVPYQRLDDKRLNSFAYTDSCLGAFIDSLKRTTQWSNLLIVLIPDHGSSSRFTPRDPQFYRIPMLWLGGAVKNPLTVHTLMNQSDMAATLLAQLGLPHDDFPYSRNIFSPHYTYPFAYSTFIDGFLFADSTGVTIFDNTSRTAVLSAPAPDAARELKGKAILQHSYDELSKN